MSGSRHAACSELPLLDPAESRRILTEFNDTRREYPPVCVHQMFEQQAARTPEAIAVIQDEEPLSYRELNRRASLLADELRAAGVTCGVAVGLLADRSIHSLIGLLAILKAGGVYVPLDASYPSHRLAFMREAAAIAVILANVPVPESFRGVPAIDLSARADSRQEPVTEDRNQPFPSDLAYVIFTSGSTGQPKPVAIPHRTLTNLISWQLERLSSRAEAKVLQFAPWSFDVSIQEVFSTLCSGGTLILIAQHLRQDPSELLEFLKTAAVTRVFLPPIVLQQLVGASDRTAPPTSLREVICAGEPLHITPAVARFFKSLPSCSLENQYGPSETHVATSWTLPPDPDSWEALPPIGYPIANTKIYILDEYRQSVPVGVTGELYIGGAAVGSGYLNRPDLTSERFLPSPFGGDLGGTLYATGDLARYRQGGAIEFLGRIDHQVKVRGFRVELGEIEITLTEHPKVRAAVVLARDLGGGNKRLVAYVTPVNEEVPVARELRDLLKKRLPEYMIPSRFVILDVLPLTSNGKVDRAALPLPVDGQRREDFTPPRNQLEQSLTTILSDILQRDSISVTDSFFDLGGDSLEAAILVNQIQNRFGVKIATSRLLSEDSVERLAAIIERPPAFVGGSVVPFQSAGSNYPFFCVHGLGGSVIAFRNLAKSFGSDQPFFGLQAAGIDDDHMPHIHVEEMAAHYVEQIRRTQPAGPYHIGGWSLGGWIAFEIARQLTNAGERVRLLALLDSAAPDIARMDGLREHLQFRTGVMVNRVRARWRRWLEFDLPGKLEYVASIVRASLNLRRSSFAHPRANPGEILPEGYGDIKKAHTTALRKYAPAPYSGDAILFRTREAEADHARDAEFGWGNLVLGDLKTEEIPGDHYTMLSEPHVQVLAEKLRAACAPLRRAASAAR